MKKTGILTDSHSGITQEEAKKLGIYVLPMPFYINDQCHYEGKDISREEFIELLKNDENVSTSQPSPEAVMNLWDEILKEYEDMENCRIIRLCPEKDDTDTLLALKEAMRRGYDDIMIIGGLGGRIDHTLANISLTAFAAQHGAVCHLIEIFAIHNDSIMVKKGYWKWLSVFAAGSEVRGVSLRGLKYPLQEAVLTNTYPIGVSNEFVSSSAVVTAAQGTLLIVLSDLD